MYSHAGQSERWVDLCRRVIAAEAGPHTITRACLVMALYFLGEGDEARVASEGLLDAADATHNPMTACFALLAQGLAYHDADPVAAYDALRRALTVAGESGNRQMESAAAVTLWIVAATERRAAGRIAHNPWVLVPACTRCGTAPQWRGWNLACISRRWPICSGIAPSALPGTSTGTRPTRLRAWPSTG